MNTELSDAQIASYRENGFVVLDDFLTADELEQWREAVDEAVGLRGKQKLPDGRWEEAGTEFYDKVFTQRINLWKDNEKVRELMIDERIGKLATDLEGVEGMRVWHDQALIKAPWGNATAWHKDVPYWSFHSPHATSIWIALDDATLENGCLFFLPGTHKTLSFENTGIDQNMAGIFEVHPEFATIESVAAPMKAGSCSFHNGLTVHGAHANMTPGYRRAMTCGFMPEGSTFNGQWNILTEEQVNRLEVGDVMADDDQNPLLYSRK